VRQVALPQLRVEVESVEEGQTRPRTLGGSGHYRAVEVDDRRRSQLAEVGVEGGDAGEVRSRGRRGGGLLGGDQGM
jgi:hypothetical protein